SVKGFVVPPSDGSLYREFRENYQLPPEGRTTNFVFTQSRSVGVVEFFDSNNFIWVIFGVDNVCRSCSSHHSAKRATRGNPKVRRFAKHGAYRAKEAQAAFLVGYFQSEPVS